VGLPVAALLQFVCGGGAGVVDMEDEPPQESSKIELAMMAAQQKQIRWAELPAMFPPHKIGPA
jgi:hypothetical protein